jgi:hypothetical protein
MSNFFWGANGNYVKKNIIEHLSKGFTANEDNICIDDTCLTKNELILLKQKVTGYSIFDSVNKKDILSTEEVKVYMKEIFRMIHNSENDEQKIINIEKYLAHGIYNQRLGVIKKFSPKYKNLDFLKFFMSADDFNIGSAVFTENDIKGIIENNYLTNPGDKRKNFVLELENNIAVNPKYHYVIFGTDKKVFILYKVHAKDYFWKILITYDSLIEEMTNEFDQLFATTYKAQFDNINEINSKEQITKIEYMKLIDDYKIISIMDGKYNFNVLKDNLMLKQYNIPLKLNKITNEYFDATIYNSNSFSLKQLSDDNIAELKIKMGLASINNKYYELDATDTFNIYLLNVKQNEESVNKWQVLYLEGTTLL